MFLNAPLILCRWLLCAALIACSVPALSEPYQAQNESLHTFFTALSVPLGLPIIVSRAAARKRISGTYDLDMAQSILETVAQQQDLIWYSDGQVLYLYDSDEAKSSAVTLRHISVERLRGLMRRAGLEESRYPLREGTGKMFYVSGPPNYVDHVLRLAQLMDKPRSEVRVGAQAFAVVQVLNTHVADRQYVMGGESVNVPGMASMIERLLATEQKGAGQRGAGLLADKTLAVIAYPDTNSLLIKGKPAQVKAIEALVTELDMPKRAIEVSLWLIDVDRDELLKIDPGWGRDTNTPSTATRVLEPLEDNRLMAGIGALERRRRATITALPVILTQENVPAVFQDNQTFYLSRPGAGEGDWQPVRYSTQASVLPRFAEKGQIEVLLTLEDGRQIGKPNTREHTAAVGQVSMSTVVRVPLGRRLFVGGFRREAGSNGVGAGRNAQLRLFVVQARAVGRDLNTTAGAIGPPPLTQAQQERVQRAFARPTTAD